MSYAGDLRIGEGIEVRQLQEGHELPEPSTQDVFCTKDSGYRGFWHGQTPTGDEYAYKYSGGLGTYCAKHYPFSVYSPAVNKTFFCWGGTPADSHLERFGKEHSADTLRVPGLLYHMVSYYDHDTDTVPKPTILLDKWCGDAHDNPVISIDDDGYIWIFSPSHGPWTTPSYVHRCTKPYQIDTFEPVRTDLFAYPQVHRDETGFLMFHTLYTNLGRTACFRTLDSASRPGPLVVLAQIDQGHYQVSTARGNRIATAFNYHPAQGGLEARTNLYYLESSDSNYDTGSLFIEAPDKWQIVAPTEPGPQAGNPGGEVAVWTSLDRGNTWAKTKDLTSRSSRNHTYVRRTVNSGNDFAAFWADGNPRKPSPSSLYFTDGAFNDVRRLPEQMNDEYARPET